MDRPCVARGFRDGEVGLALMYPALAEQCSWPSWISARIQSHKRIGPLWPTGSPEHECDGATVFHLVFLSQTSASSKPACGRAGAIPPLPRRSGSLWFIGAVLAQNAPSNPGQL